MASIMALTLAIFGVAQGQAAAPRYDLKVFWGDTNLTPGGQGQFTIQARNIGDGTAEEVFTIADELPEGVEVTKITWDETPFGDLSFLCSGVSTRTATCELPEGAGFLTPTLAPAQGEQGTGPTAPAEPTGYLPEIFVDVAISPGATGVGTNRATFSGGGSLAPVSDEDQVRFSDTPSSFGIVPGSFAADVFDAEYPFGVPSRQAGDHPFEQRVNFDFNHKTGVDPDDGTRYVLANAGVKDVEATLPRGFLGNPEATPKCDPVAYATEGASVNSRDCPSDTQVGYLRVWFNPGTPDYGRGNFKLENLSRVAIYNLVPPKGQIADFGFTAGGGVQGHIYPTLDPAHNYAIKAVSPNISNGVAVAGTEVTLWGVPADPAHDKFRFYPKVTEGKATGASWDSAAIRPFFTNPMDCGTSNGGTQIRADSYNHPGEFTPVEENSDAFDVAGCDDPRFRFKPQISLQPTSHDAGGPTGLDVSLEVPQRNDEAADAKELYAVNGGVKAIATPPVKEAVVTLPEGMTLSPSAAQGLGSCSPSQIGLVSTHPIRFNDAPVTCPDNSQYGKLALHTPDLPVNAQPEGFVYVAKQNDNPFNNFLSLYLVIEEPDRGLLVKIPGRVDLDPNTGQIKTTFEDLPQFPVSTMQLSLKGGVRAGLVNPSTCGTKTIRAEFFSWADPSTPHVVEDSYSITRKADGSPCINSLGERPFKPALQAGTENNTGGTYSSFLMRLTRTDDDQEFSQVGITLPPGLAAKFAGVGICPEAGIAQAEERTAAGDGAREQASPSCPASSLIGTTEVGAGVGVPLTYVPGKIYLAGPYRGAPISVVVISPVIVGPFDLGVIAVRTALDVNPVTAQGSARSDPFPQIFQGIPVRIRDIRLNLDRSGFTLNPTSCAEKQINAHVTGTGGEVASTTDDTGVDLVNRFQAADCASLGFRPGLRFRLFGATHRGGHPRLRAVVTYPRGGGYANVARASVALPHSEFLDQSHIKTVCTRTQFAAKACPAGSIYGHVIAKTPLFDQPLSGPIYLRSSSHQLPDLVAALRGPAYQPVEVDLDGRIDSVHGGIRNTFELVPDAPVTQAVFTFEGGGKGLLVNSTNLCSGTSRAIARFVGQNGKRLTLHPRISNSCHSGHGKGHGSRRHPGR